MVLNNGPKYCVLPNCLFDYGFTLVQYSVTSLKLQPDDKYVAAVF